MSRVQTTMKSKNYYWNLSIVFLTLSTVHSHEVVTLSSDSVATNDKIIGSNIHAATNEPPVHEGALRPVDFPSPNTNETLKNHNITKLKYDSHTYYNSTIVNDDKLFNHYWVDLIKHPDANLHEMLSDSHRRAVTFKLKFQFPFYGYLINSITLATGGFLYLGDYIHSWLSATQFIAPLMANFDLRVSNDSNIYYMSNDSAFTVMWHNVTLQDKPEIGGFTFQTTLYSNGNIVFAYKHLPIKIKDINSINHPVKIGLSDAYVMDKTLLIERQKTIYEYHRVTFQEVELSNNSVIILTALPTCLERKKCTSCIKKDNNLQCYWCDNRCSSGIDRNRQDWFKKNCDKLKLNPGDICVSEKPILPPALIEPESDANSSSFSTGLFFIALCVLLIIMSLAWMLYAYLNPHTRSGQLLIRYEQYQWCWRKGENPYSAATIYM